LNENLEK